MVEFDQYHQYTEPCYKVVFSFESRLLWSKVKAPLTLWSPNHQLFELIRSWGDREPENQRTREPTVWVKSSDLMWQTSKSKLQRHDCPRKTNDTPVTHKTQAWILWLYNSKSNTYPTFRYWWRLSSSQRLNSSPADLFQSSAVTKKNAASVLNSRKSTCDLNPALLMGAAARCGRQPLRGRASPLHARSRNRRSKYTHLH